MFGLAFGNLNNGVANSGLSCLNGNNALSNATWNYLARLTGDDISLRRAIHPEGKIDNKTTWAGRCKLNARDCQKGFNMRKSCKNIDITDAAVVYPWVYDCIMRHKKRHDFRDMLRRYGGMSRGAYYQALRDQNAAAFVEPSRKIAQEAARRIASRDLQLRPVRMRERRDRSSGKIRLIGDEDAMQQILDHIAVGAAQDIFRRRIVENQVSSIPGRGQVFGAKRITKWIQADNRAAKYAHAHGLKYSRKCKYFVKLDVRKCYPSMRKEMFMRLFARDCGNADLLWLWDALLESHKVDGYQGFMIGALPSQWACQYVLSFVFRYAVCLVKQRRGKTRHLITHMLLYADDMLMFSSSRRDLKSATRQIEKYMRNGLGLEIKPQWQIQETAQHPVDMMGFVMHGSGKITIRARVFLRARRIALRFIRRGRLTVQQARRAASYKGYFKHSDSAEIIKKLDLRTLFCTAARIISKFDRRANDDRQNVLLH